MINLMIKLLTVPVLIQLLLIKRREKRRKVITFFFFLAFTMYQAQGKHPAFLILFKLHNNPTKQTRSLSLFYR